MAKKTNYKKKTTTLKLSKIVHLLGKILGLVIKEQEGIFLFNKIEKIRTLSKASRGKKDKKKIRLNETKKFRQLKSNIRNLSARESLIIARSFSKFLNFSNLAESLYSVQKIHIGKVRKAQGTNEFIILGEAIERLLKHKSISKNSFFQIAKNLKINLVLTAHPTEVKRRTLIQKYTKVNDILERFNNLRIFMKKNIEKLNLKNIIFKLGNGIEGWKNKVFKNIFGNKLNINNLENLGGLCENLISENNVSDQLVDSFAKKYLSNLNHSASFAANYLTNKSKYN